MYYSEKSIDLRQTRQLGALYKEKKCHTTKHTQRGADMEWLASGCISSRLFYSHFVGMLLLMKVTIGIINVLKMELPLFSHE